MANESGGNGHTRVPNWLLGLVCSLLVAMAGAGGGWMYSLGTTQSDQAAKIAAIETEQKNVGRRLERIENKLDALLDRRP